MDAENRKGEARMTPADTLISGLVRCHVCCWPVNTSVSYMLPCPVVMRRCTRVCRSLRNLALLLTGLLLYLPAIFTVMYTTSPDAELNTILAASPIGRPALRHRDSDFHASFPCRAPNLAFSRFLIATTRRAVSGRVRRRPVSSYLTYRYVMLDAWWWLCRRAVPFPGSIPAEPRIGIVFFGAVVMFTLLAAMKFDPRLLWENNKHE